MSRQFDPPGNIILLRGACLWLLVALLLAWCMVGLFLQVPLIQSIFSGKFSRLLQGHIDFLLMTALILGIYATKTLLPWHVRWAMVIGAFTNSSLFVLLAAFPSIDSPTPPSGFFPSLYQVYLYSSLILTSYGFGRAAVLILLSTFQEDETDPADRVAPVTSGPMSDGGKVQFQRSAMSRYWSPARRFAMRRSLRQYLTSPTRNDPLVMWLIFTGLSIFAVYLLWFYGLAQKVIEGDPTRVSLLIIGLYVTTSLHCLYRARALSSQAVKTDEVARIVQSREEHSLPNCAVATYIGDLKAKAGHEGEGKVDSSILLRVLAERLRGSNDLGAFSSDALMKLGLLGTIIGFIIMLAPIADLDPENTAAVKMSMGVMSNGMAIAMYTTLTGLVASLLVKLQYRIVEKAASGIFTSAVELTEVHIKPSLQPKLDVAA